LTNIKTQSRRRTRKPQKEFSRGSLGGVEKKL
jgi:hypothetical protein